MNVPNGRKDNRKLKGALAETAAVAKLIDEGYRVLERNWRCRTGELDIIADQAGILVFIEVRSRTGTASFGTPSESVDARKILQVRQTAEQYMYRKRCKYTQIRFDVIAVMLNGDMTVFSIEHIQDAF
ncbi:YraN family protein [Paenibacillus sp. JCM 10914]|uniref:YraN family protein n=1 Tax=Paenibacillus sp. JCM 10914 TaxID=1236974 RepID=UPI0003CC7402|nr:YraN family protein [Paenibacillus sp. JCM 10914]GAE04752.1 hypothetical protein JCM10914_823 [Paenibacillus sp. JCM 10914]